MLQTEGDSLKNVYPFIKAVDRICSIIHIFHMYYLVTVL